MKKLTKYDKVIEHIGDQGLNDTPLYARFRYRKDDVHVWWGKMSDEVRALEMKFLVVDLGFPIWYGFTFRKAISLMHEKSHCAWPELVCLSPVLITMLADWTENAIHLLQLQAFNRKGKTKDALSGTAIGIANIATVFKMFFFLVSFVMIAVVCIAAKIAVNEGH